MIPILQNDYIMVWIAKKITSRTTGAKGFKFEQFYLYWTIFFIYLSPSCLSQSILVCLNLCWFILLYLGSAVFSYLYSLWSISGYIEILMAILDKNWISRAISGYHELSRALSGYNELSWLLFWKSIMNSLLKIRSNF